MLKTFLFATLILGVVQGESITAIASGTGYRSCIGYCYNSVYINVTNIITTKFSQSNPNDYPDVEQIYSIEQSEFDQLVEDVGYIQLWKSVDSPIGCPDCNDQGLEWIDVYTDEQPKYGVQFEATSTIAGYESLVDGLRSIRQRYFSTSA